MARDRKRNAIQRRRVREEHSILKQGRFGIPLAIVAILTALAAVGVNRSGAATNGIDGATIYAAKCLSCHQSNGRGTGPYPALAHNPNVTAIDTQQLIATVVGGRYGPVTILGRTYGAPMPTERGLLSDAQIAAVLTYIRSAWETMRPRSRNSRLRPLLNRSHSAVRRPSLPHAGIVTPRAGAGRAPRRLWPAILMSRRQIRGL